MTAVSTLTAALSLSEDSGSVSVSLKGIFAYLNYQVPRTRKEIFETLVKGLQRLEYRGYDSAGETLNFTVSTPTHVYTRTTDAFSSPV